MPRDNVFCTIQDGVPTKNNAGEWRVTRTITKSNGRGVSGHKNIYANNLGINGEPVLIVTKQSVGDLPPAAKFDNQNQKLTDLAKKNFPIQKKILIL